MIPRYLAIALCALLPACAAQVSGSTPGTPASVAVTLGTTPAPAVQNPLGGLATLTQADLATSLRISAAYKDTEGTACFTFLSGQLSALQGQAASFIQPTGLISTFEAGHVGLGIVQGGLSPAQKVAIDTACGPYLMNVLGGLNALLAQFGVAGVSIGAN